MPVCLFVPQYVHVCVCRHAERTRVPFMPTSCVQVYKGESTTLLDRIKERRKPQGIERFSLSAEFTLTPAYLSLHFLIWKASCSVYPHRGGVQAEGVSERHVLIWIPAPTLEVFQELPWSSP